MLSFVVVVLLHVVGGNESLVTLPPIARDTRWCGRHLSHQLVVPDFMLHFVEWAILRILMGETMSICWLVWDITSVGIRMDVKEMMFIQQRTRRATHGIFRIVFLS